MVLVSNLNEEVGVAVFLTVIFILTESHLQVSRCFLMLIKMWIQLSGICCRGHVCLFSDSL